MRRTLYAVVCGGLALAAATRAEAAMLGDAAVPFRAQRTVTVDGRTYSGTMFHIPGHQRHEQVMFGMQEVFLLDTKSASGFLVLPGVHTYVAFLFPPLMAELDSPDLTRTPEGEETISGILTTKYRIHHLADDGSRAEGHLWLSRSGILMKLDVLVRRAHGGRPMAIGMQLSQIETGKVDPGLFVLPEGFMRLPNEALTPLLGGTSG
jgi:hypothetical protein